MSKKTVVEMFVGGLALDPATHAPIVVLRDAEDKLHIPIWIGPSEATSIATVLRGIPLTRPLTHDLMYEVMRASDLKVQEVVISDLRDATYYAELAIVKGESLIVIDSRPSDAIAIALRAGAPIYVNYEVIQQANVVAQVIVKEQQGRYTKRDIEDENFADADENINGIDKKRWKEILDKLDPDDFKFKV